MTKILCVAFVVINYIIIFDSCAIINIIIIRRMFNASNEFVQQSKCEMKLQTEHKNQINIKVTNCGSQQFVLWLRLSNSYVA